MIKLKNSIGEIYFYIKDGIVFNILSYNNGDVCAKKGVEIVKDANKEVKVPYIDVTDNNAEEVKTIRYFLTNAIEDGDKFSNSTFYKHNDSSDSDMTIASYYEMLCQEEIKRAICDRPSGDYNFFNNSRNLIEIPSFMYNDSNCSVVGVSQISFNEEYFNTLKEEVVKKEVLKQANNKANTFGYKVVSNVDSFDVELIES